GSGLRGARASRGTPGTRAARPGLPGAPGPGRLPLAARAAGAGGGAPPPPAHALPRDLVLRPAPLARAAAGDSPRRPRPLLATLHAPAPLVRSQEFGTLTAVYYRLVVRPTLRRARGLLTVSEF